MWQALWLLVGCLGFSGVVHAESSWWDRIFGEAGESVSAPLLAEEPQAEASQDGVPVPGNPSASSGPVFSLTSDYKLGPGDRLMIVVFNEKDLSIDVRLSDSGTLSFPLLGEIRAQGMTVAMLNDYLTEQLGRGYLVNPKVYVSIVEYRPLFVTGEVSRPGALSYQPGLTVRKAVALSGGFTPRASYTKIFIIHEDDPFGQPRPANLNTPLRPGDILTIEQSFF
ncbi:MAG: polysaccharide export protein [bacterium]|nr:polysaccharide export protein [bacterium]